jgi:hypothetical protein
MGIYTKRIQNSYGISYTKEVDSQVDWTGVTNSTYFKDLSDGLIYYKDPSGTVISIYEQNVTLTGGTYSANTITFTDNTGSGFSVTGITAGSGEVNTASNIGGGEGLFSGKSGTDLQFKTLTSTGGTITITSTGATVNLEGQASSTFPYRSTAVSGSVLTTDWTVDVTTTGDTTQTLPTAVGASGKVYNIKNSDSTETSTVTLATTGSELIDGTYGNGTDLTFKFPVAITVQSTGTGWIII